MTTSFHIRRLGHQGDGIADGPVFAPRTLPGETVTGTQVGDRLTEIRIVDPSGDRVSPPCRHYKSCGGCQLQHASDDFVAAWKQDVVRTALAAQDIEAELRPIHTSPSRSRRRATLAVRRTKKGALVGFHARASDIIIEIPDCHLLLPELMAALPVAEDLATLGGSRKGELAVTVTQSMAGLDMAVTGGKSLDGPLELALAQATERHRLARLAWDGEVIAMREPPAQQFGPAAVVPPPGAFLQATHDAEQTLLAAVQEAVGPAARVADLFAGCGTFSLPLAKRAEVHAVEGAKDMVVALDQGWRRAEGLKKLTTEARDLFRRPLMVDELARFHAVVLDPPRAGAEAQVAELARAQVPTLAYVSCNPVSFARDAKTLVAAGYRLEWVQVVDQFRWSPHVELAAKLTLDHIGAE
ncbi:class I SAM-dependent RNA methyltransferase [Lutimaribacter marinistellae]|uniref:Class I SAM-dependent RNA methyltransferase n=1 Tax=Lutimaribacter marinistellae TaxID=1820329 RepID=A0ABV7TE40_9RHOB